uniref:RNA-directed RNA polymerase n=1 Tax=Dipteran tombus-related virus TaxID=2822553 RepID=A0A8A6RRU5_9TOMB|nr:RNA-dependent RNA polymerase [Dipteran tombus-related virus]
MYYPNSESTVRAGYANRHKPIILAEYRPNDTKRIGKHLRKNLCHPTPWSRERYINSMGDIGKIKQYTNTNETHNKLGRIKTHLNTFTKIEKTRTDKYKPPRLIQPRHQSFNIEYGRYIKPLEITLTKKHTNKHNFGKGNYDEIAQRIDKLRRKYQYYTEGDHKTFDAHVTIEHLKMTHKFYQKCYNNFPAINKLARKTLVNNCVTTYGMKTKIKGTRMSGDVDTSIGNSLINLAILRECIHRLKIHGDAIVNGDDFILFTNQPIPRDIMVAMLRQYNMETDMKQSTTNIHTVEFCRTKFIYRNNGTVTMMFDPDRIQEIFGMTYQDVPCYLTYLIELSVAIKEINKNTIIGLMINKEILTHINNIKPQKKHIKLEKIKTIVDRNIRRCVNRETGTEPETIFDYNQSMLHAYKNILELPRHLSRIREIIISNAEQYDGLTKHKIEECNAIVIKTIHISHRGQKYLW